MCGIVGVFPLKQKNLQVDPELIKQMALWFHNEILFHTVKRGKDATGIAVSLGGKLGPDGQMLPAHWSTLKQAVDTEDFFNNDGTESKYTGQEDIANIKNMMTHVIKADRPFLHVIGHARAKTVGSEYNPNNNHPIVVGNIIGIHNGGVKNHKRIYEKHPNMKPLGEVDSEAIMQLLAEVSNDKPLDKAAVDYVCERIEGPRAVLAYNSMHPSRIAFFRDTERPMECAFIKEFGLLIMYSEKEFLKHALGAYQRLRVLENDKLPKLTVEHMTVISSDAGIIDLNKEIDKCHTLSSVVELFTSKSTLPEYKLSYTVPSTNTGTSSIGSHSDSRHKGYTTQSSSTSKQSDVSDVVNTELYDHTDYDTKAAAGGYVDEEGDANNGPGVEIDLSELADDKGDGGAFVTTATVQTAGPGVAAEGNDDDEEEEDEYEIPFDSEYIRGLGEKAVLDPEFYKNRPDYTIPKHRHGIDKLILTHKLSTEEKHEVLQAIYLPSFSDGVEEGFSEGWMHAMGSEAEEISKRDEKIEGLEESLEELQGVAYKATSHMANLKSFLLAVLLCHNMVDIGEDGEVLFDSDIEEFLSMSHNGFSKVDAKRIRKLFTNRDKQRINNSIAKLANPKNRNTNGA